MEEIVPLNFHRNRYCGYKQTCLLNTGCDYSLIPRRLVPTALLSPVDLDIFATNGAHINILGCRMVQFYIQGMRVFAYLLVLDDIYEFMLGYDWLEAQGVHWNFDKKSIHGCEIHLQQRTSRSSVSRVWAQDWVGVEALAEQDMPVKVVRESLHTTKTDWLLESQTLVEGMSSQMQSMNRQWVSYGSTVKFSHVVSLTWDRRPSWDRRSSPH